MEDCLKILGKRIKIYRKIQNMSQEELGRKAGLHYSYIGQVERGERNVTIMNLNKISDALGIPLHSLFTLMEAKDFMEDSKDDTMRQFLLLTYLDRMA